ncbi:ParB/RepB/Spo0J family partition protein [Roseomonas xinghualingensis]|uniref:ParB/RepB/Spo0J family partition protein n=1 Tax=Roseomonas xinghualingensis TaxID=2986475 RepID=UPI0021F22562|nr:ParB/RepB/Spo0J family partition protein [Roseomonas sp. SXEYE001]MCV4210176.1 ParB/RepB/Spo0J family partition protein [Roseomonas sp. SXEYE001]
MAEITSQLTDDEIDEGAAPEQPFAPLAAFDRVEMSLQEKLARTQEQLERAESALEAAKASGAQGTTAARAELDAVLAENERLKAMAASAGSSERLAEFRYIDPSRIEDGLPPDRFDVAYSAEEIAGLAENIRQRGQDLAILVRPKPGSSPGEAYEIAAGKRRLAACRLLGITVLARVRELSDEGMLAARFSENHHREDLSAFERARYFALTMERTGLNGSELATIYGVDKSLISHLLKLTRIPDAVIRSFRNPRSVSFRKARELLDVLLRDPTAEDRIVRALRDLAQRVASGDAAAQEAEEISTALAAARRQAPAPRLGRRAAARPIYLGRRQVATVSQRDGRWQVRFDSLISEELVERLSDRLPSILEDLENELQRTTRVA